ncbi:outer membrane protein assembly factor BamA [Planctomycetota bacterium]
MVKSVHLSNWFMLFLLLPALVSLGADDQLPVESIKVTGNVSISDTEVLSRVRSRVGQMFDAVTATEDASRIAEIEGVSFSYYSSETVDNKIRLTFVVGEKNLVRSVEFVGNRKYSDKKLLKKVKDAGVKIGDYLTMVSAESAREKLDEYYLKKGYAFASVSLDNAGLSNGRVVYNVQEGPRVRIVSVCFSGNEFLKSKALKKAIKSRKRKFLVFRKYYEQSTAEKDLDRLVDIYYQRGFLDVKTTLQKQFNEKKNKVVLTFLIEEGPAYKVGQVMVIGNTYFDSAELSGWLKLKQGQTYDQRKADADLKELGKRYREIGFVDVKVNQNRRFARPGEVTVEIEITHGQRFRIGQVNITGNADTKDKVIRRVLNEYDFMPGQWYNADIARGDGSGYLEKLIRRTTYTQSAVITTGERTADVSDAQVNVIEGQTGSIMLGAGVASDSGVMGQLVFEQKNFDISDKPESFKEFFTGQAFKGAGQTLRIALEPGTEVSSYSINFTEPYLNDRPISLNVGGSSWEREQETYDEQRTKGYVGFEKRYKSGWRRSVGFRVENVDVGDLDADAPKEIVDVKGNNAVFGVRFGVSRDLTDDRFNPSSGRRFSASLEPVAGDESFAILLGTHTWYKTLREDLADRKTVLSTKLHGGAIFGDAQPFEKFYAGGSSTLRGFDYRGVSTRGGTGKDPIGSDWIFLANAEVAVPMVGDSLSWLLFVDSGMIDSGGYRASIGTGIQLLIPQWFGPVPMRFEIATPFMKDGDDETQVFSFSVGKMF